MSRTVFTAIAGHFSPRAAYLTSRRRLGALHDPGLTIGETHLELMPYASAVRAHVKHKIRQIAPLAGRGFVLDLMQCPFVLDDIKCSAPSRIYQVGSGLVIEPEPEVELSGASLEYVFDWCPTGPDVSRNIRFLRFPDDFPIPLSELDPLGRTTGFAAGSWTIVRDELLRDFTVGGVSLWPNGKYGAGIGPLLRGCIVPNDLIGERSSGRHTDVLITNAAVDLFRSTVRKGSLAIVVEEAVVFLSSLFGKYGSDMVLIAGPGDRPFGDPTFGGPALLLDEQFAVKYPLDSIGARFELVREFSSVPWGSGCRILGGAAAELTAAVGVAAALRWAEEYADPQYVTQTDLAFKQLASRSRFRDFVDTSLGKLGSRLVGGLSRSMCQRMHDESYRMKLAWITDELWSFYVPYDIAMRDLEL